MNADDGFGGRTLEKSACLRVNDLADEIVGAGVANIEFDGFIEFDEFEQISLTFIWFQRRFGLSKRDGRKKDKTKCESRKSEKWFFHSSAGPITVLFDNCAPKVYFMSMNEDMPKEKTAARWIKRFGVAGFLFFLIKGLIWLALLIGATYFGYDFIN